MLNCNIKKRVDKVQQEWQFWNNVVKNFLPRNHQLWRSQLSKLDVEGSGGTDTAKIMCCVLAQD